MITIKEYFRSFFVSVEMVVWAAGFCVFVFFGERINHSLSEWQPSEGKVMWLLTIPGGLVAWVLKSWRQMLFQDADKQFLLQKWPDFWRLEIVLICAVAHAVLFFLVAATFVLLPSWNPPSSLAVIALVVSIIGLLVDGFTCYKADIELAKAVRNLDANRMR